MGSSSPASLVVQFELPSLVCAYVGFLQSHSFGVGISRVRIDLGIVRLVRTRPPVVLGPGM